MPNIIYSGNNIGVSVQLYRNGVADPIDNGATVTAAILDNTQAVIAGPWTCSNAAAGASWATGLIVVPVAAADTTAAFTGGRTAPFTSCKMEIKVVEGSDSLTRRTTETFTLVKSQV